jgi:hypothetical protein
MLFAIIFSSALYGQVAFPQKNLSIPLRRVEILKISGLVFYWTSTDTTVALVSGGVVTPKKVGWTLVIAEDSLRTHKDTCLISIVPWNAGISDFKYELYLSGFKLEGIFNDTLMLNCAGYLKDWSSQYIYHSSMSKPKLLSNFKCDGSFSYDIESGLPTPFGNYILAKRETVNAPRKIYKADYSSSSMKVVDAAYPADTSLIPFSTVMYNGWSYDANLHNVYMGQYTSLDSGYENYRIRILKGTDDSPWQTVYTFPARKDTGYYGGIRHVHAVQTDPYTGDVWIATGDANSQSRIYRNTNHMTPDSTGNAPLELIGVGSPEFRVVSFSFSRSYIYYFMDAPSNPQSIFRIPRMSSYPTMYDNKPATLNTYRQVVGTFKDKPFYGNFQYDDNGNRFTILEAAWEDVKHYGTSNFREIDSVVRVYALRESASGDAQVQEIFALPGLQDYSHLYPVGMDSKGYMYFSSVFIGQSTLRAVYRGKLTWRELDSVQLQPGQNGVNFSKHSIKLSCAATAKDNICAYKASAPSLDAMPPTIKSITDNFWNTYIGNRDFSNGVLSIPVSAINNFDSKFKNQFTWVMRTKPGGPWINIGGKVRNDSLISNISITQLNDFGIAIEQFPVNATPDTIKLTNPKIGSSVSLQITLYNNADSTIVIDSVGTSNAGITPSFQQNFPILIPSAAQIGTTAVLYIQTLPSDNNNILVYSGGSVVGEVPISQKTIMNNSDISLKSFSVSSPYPNPFNGGVNVHCYTKTSGKFYLKIFNILGQVVYSNAYEAPKEGDYNIRWEPRTNPSGVYIMCVQFGDSNSPLTSPINRKITFLK